MRSLKKLITVERHGRGAVKVVGEPLAVAEAHPAGIVSKVEVYRLDLNKRGYCVEGYFGDDKRCGVFLSDSDGERRTLVSFNLPGIVQREAITQTNSILASINNGEAKSIFAEYKKKFGDTLRSMLPQM